MISEEKSHPALEGHIICLEHGSLGSKLSKKTSIILSCSHGRFKYAWMLLLVELSERSVT